MIRVIPFVKMHGLGNDFVIIKKRYIPRYLNIKDLVISISNRRTGIGCDQLILYAQKYNKIDMVIYNQDGSKAKACGNASRCITRLMFNKYGLKNTYFDIEGRSVFGQYINETRVEVDMGTPSFDVDWMPNSADLVSLAEKYMIEPKEMICVDVANPHVVIFSKLSKKEIDTIGNNFQKSDLFQDGVNVNFAVIQGCKIYLQVWERGASFTHACGSGAVATFAAANKLGLIHDTVEIVFKFGSLNLKKEKNIIKMSGPSTYVFSGDYLYEK